METLPLACSGIQLGPLAVPAFAVQRGELVSLQLPENTSAANHHALIDILTGRHPHDAVQICGRVRWAKPAAFPRNYLAVLRSGRLTQPKPADWLLRKTSLSRAEADGVVARLGLRSDWRLCHLAANPRALLGWEAALSHQPDVIGFDTVGLDPSGIRALFTAVTTGRGRCAAIYLSTCVSCGGTLERSWLADSRCVEVRCQGSRASISAQTPN